jgi:hypothetical protein
MAAFMGSRTSGNQSESTAHLFLALMHFKSGGVPMSVLLAMMWVELGQAGKLRPSNGSARNR